MKSVNQSSQFTWARVTAAALLFAMLSACSTTVKTANSVPVIEAEQVVATAALLDVGIVVFDANVPEDPEEQLKAEEKGIFPRVRRAEARYMPYVLRTTMESTNQWGAVRVIPEPNTSSELIVRGRIEFSDGHDLKVSVQAYDATGRVWLRKSYSDIATKFAYREDVNYVGDPFQDVYNRIANDLYEARQRLDHDYLTKVRQVASLRYAAELSPEAFAEHLKYDRQGRIALDRLPSEDDPMLSRVNRIRESEYLFIDTVDQHFGNFYHRMDPTYHQFRRFSYDEVQALEENKRAARMRALAGIAGVVGGAVIDSKARTRTQQIVGQGAVFGGLAGLKQAWDVHRAGDIHTEQIKELAASFDAEVQPAVFEVEGEVIQLNGTLQNQYTQWRTMLQRIYREETGLGSLEQASIDSTANEAVQ